MSTTNALELYKKEALPALKHDVKGVLEAMKENLGNTGFSERDLTVIKFPASGATFFEVPTLEGPQPEKALVGVIVFQRDGRAFWNRPFGEGDDEDATPDCQSRDGLVGIGIPGGNCLTCALSRFGSAPGKNGQPGRGQACQQKKFLYMLRGDQLIPDLIRVPATSLDALKTYLLDLTKNSIPYYRALTGIVLNKEKNKDGIEYAEAKFVYIRKLDEPEAMASTMWNATMKTIAKEASENIARMVKGERPLNDKATEPAGKENASV